MIETYGFQCQRTILQKEIGFNPCEEKTLIVEAKAAPVSLPVTAIPKASVKKEVGNRLFFLFFFKGEAWVVVSI